MQYKTTRIPGGTVVREIHPNGFERAFRKFDKNGHVSVSYGHKGPWILAGPQNVPADVWFLLITKTRGDDDV